MCVRFAIRQRDWHEVTGPVTRPVQRRDVQQTLPAGLLYGRPYAKPSGRQGLHDRVVVLLQRGHELVSLGERRDIVTRRGALVLYLHAARLQQRLELRARPQVLRKRLDGGVYLLVGFHAQHGGV